MASVFMAAGAAVLLGLTPGTSYPVLAASYVLLGIGFGVVKPPGTNTAVSGMPAAQAGVASAIASTARQIGIVLGVAVMGAMVATSAFGAGRLSRRVGASFTAATHLPWMLAAACGVACAVVALVCTGRRGLAAATRVCVDDAPAAPQSKRPPDADFCVDFSSPRAEQLNKLLSRVPEAARSIWRCSSRSGIWAFAGLHALDS